MIEGTSLPDPPPQPSAYILYNHVLRWVMCSVKSWAVLVRNRVSILESSIFGYFGLKKGNGILNLIKKCAGQDICTGLSGSNPLPSEFKHMDRESYSPLGLMQTNLYTLMRHNSALMEITELQPRKTQCFEGLKVGLKSSAEVFRSPRYTSAVLLSRVWRGPGFQLISRQSIRTKWRHFWSTVR